VGCLVHRRARTQGGRGCPPGAGFHRWRPQAVGDGRGQARAGARLAAFTGTRFSIEGFRGDRACRVAASALRKQVRSAGPPGSKPPRRAGGGGPCCRPLRGPYTVAAWRAPPTTLPGGNRRRLWAPLLPMALPICMPRVMGVIVRG
jgi:hypothetical protein